MNSDISLLILGAGGHAKVVADAARCSGISNIAFCDEGSGDLLAQCAANATHIHVAIGDNETRERGYERAISCGLTPLTIIHPRACIASSAVIGDGVYVGAYTVVNPFAAIENYAILNTSCVVEHDCRVGIAAFVAPGAIMCGECTLGAHSFLGAHATMIPQVSLGPNVTVGAGATVLDSVEEPCLLAGTPAIKKYQKEL